VYVHAKGVSEVKMAEKKVQRISVRVPGSYKRTCRERSINISFVCRAALFQAIQQSEKVLSGQGKMRSKQRAAAIFNSLRAFFVRTERAEITQKITNSKYKTEVFRDCYLHLALPEELVVLGEFLEQGEYAEELLQEVYI
jgi:hypothetical protein